MTTVNVFAYNRPVHLKRVLAGLSSCNRFNEVKVAIYIDGPLNNFDLQKISQVSKIANNFTKKYGGEVYAAGYNKGLARSLISGISESFRSNKTLIVLEDDIIPSYYFLDFMLDGLAKYKTNSRIASISGYLPNLKKQIQAPFFRRGADCWGWATWHDRWSAVNWDSKYLLETIIENNLQKAFNLNNSYCFTCMLKRQMNEEIDSWAIRWHASMFVQNKLTLYPNKSLVTNIGFDGSGTHGGINNFYNSQISNERIIIPDIDISESKLVLREFQKTYERYFKAGIRIRVLRFLKRKVTLNKAIISKYFRYN